MDKIKQLEKEWAPVKQQADFKAGDTITVHYRISEGNKERIQQYQGVVIQRKGSGSTATFTVRKMSGSIGVERIFPVASPFLEKVEVNKHGDVNRARIFYIRERRGKSARIKERRMSAATVEANTAKAKAKKDKATAKAASEKAATTAKAETEKTTTKATTPESE